MTWTARTQKQCTFCRKPFWPRSSVQHVCDTQKCRDHYHSQEGRRALGRGYQLKLPLKRKCIVCGKFFDKSLHMSRRRFGRAESFMNYTCAKICAACRPKHTRKVMDKNQHLRRKRERANGNVYELRLRDDGFLVDGYGNKYKEQRCKQCRKLAPIRMTGHHQPGLYCSRKCRDVAGRASPEEKAAWGSRKRHCEACNKLFWAKVQNGKSAKFCSQQCFGADYRARNYRTPEQFREEARVRLSKYRSIPANKERKRELNREYRTVEYHMKRANKGELEWLKISQLELTRVRNLLAGKAGGAAATKAGRNEPPRPHQRVSPSLKQASTPRSNSRA